jgi:hypothetical protein
LAIIIVLRRLVISAAPPPPFTQGEDRRVALPVSPHILFSALLPPFAYLIFISPPFIHHFYLLFFHGMFIYFIIACDKI